MKRQEIIKDLDRRGKLCGHCGKKYSECKGHGYLDKYYEDGSYQGD